MNKAAVVIQGTPVGKGRPRFTSRGGITRTYTPKKTAEYESKIAETYQRYAGYMFEEEPLEICIDAVFQMPKSYSKVKQKLLLLRKWYMQKPDLDNICKCVLDALNGIAYADDKQICKIVATKQYTDQLPYTMITIKKLPSEKTEEQSV